MACTRSRVRISIAPPAFALTSFGWQASPTGGTVGRRSLERRLPAVAHEAKTRSYCPSKAKEGRSNKLSINSYHPKKMYYTYILKSIPHPSQIYIGFTANLKQRLIDHNSGKSPHTNKFKPWNLDFYCAFNNEEKAINFEKYLKSGSGRSFVKKHFWSCHRDGKINDFET